jgi:hypothetical protein
MFKNFSAFPGYVLFFVMLFLPSSYQPIKAILGILVLEIIAINALVHDRLTLHYSVCLWTLFMITMGAEFIFIGFLNDAPGALCMSTVYILWPLILQFLLQECRMSRDLEDC